MRHYRVTRRALASLALVCSASCSAATSSDESFVLQTSTAGTGSGTISVSPAGGEYRRGTIVTITAAPASSSVFAGWDAQDGPAACLQPVNPCTTEMISRRSAIATFVPASAIGRFDGDYVGTFDGSPAAAITLTIANGIVQGLVRAVLLPSPGAIAGTVAADGTLTAAATDEVSKCGTQSVAFTGHLGTAVASGITTSTVTGSFPTHAANEACDARVIHPFTASRRTVPASPLP